MPRDPLGEEALGGVLGRDPRPRADPRIRLAPPEPLIRRIAGPLAEGLPVVNVLDHGVLADGSDQTANLQLAIEAIPRDGGVLFFPPGTYGVGSVDVLRLHSRASVTLLGTFGCSILRRVQGVGQIAEGDLVYDDGPGILRIELCEDLTIAGLVFDANGFVASSPNQRALLLCYHSTGVRIERCQVLDGNPNPSLEAFPFSASYAQPHAVGFGFFHDPALGVPETSEDIDVRDNVMQGVGIAVHHARRVRIVGNRIAGSLGHGIALGGEVDGELHEDVEIAGNEVTEAAAFGIVVADVPADGEDVGPTCEMRRVVVARNRVAKDSLRRTMRGIVVGALVDRDVATIPRPVYADVEISDNLIELPARTGIRDPEAGLLNLGDGGDADELVGIWLQVAGALPAVPAGLPEDRAFSAATDHFDRAVVRGNLVVGARSNLGGTGIVVLNLFRGEIAGNGVYESTNGIHLRGVSYLCHVHDNRIDGLHVDGEPDGEPYAIVISAGGNTFSANAILGGPWPQQAVWRYPFDQREFLEALFGDDLVHDRSLSGDSIHWGVE